MTGESGNLEINLFRPGDELKAASDDIWQVLEATDKEFFPSLASRQGTTTKALRSISVWPGPIVYFEEVMIQCTLLARDNGKPVGLMSFIPGHYDELLAEWSPSTYITTIAVQSSARRGGVGKQLCRRLLRLDELEDRWLMTRTWSTNEASINLFSGMGFEEVLRLKDHRKKGIDTVYMAHRRQ